MLLVNRVISIPAAKTRCSRSAMEKCLDLALRTAGVAGSVTPTRLATGKRPRPLRLQRYN